MVEKYFEAYALVDQDILGSPERWNKVLALVPEDILLREAPRCWVWRGSVWGGTGSAVSAVSLDRWAQHRELLQAQFPKKRDSVQRWDLLRGKMEQTRVSGCGAALGWGLPATLLPPDPPVPAAGRGQWQERALLRGLGGDAAVLLPSPGHQRQQRCRASAEEPLQCPPQNRLVWQPEGLMHPSGAGHARW